MNTQKKQIYVNLIASILSFAVSIGVSFFLSPFIVNRIGKEAYGFIGLANNFVQYATILTTALNSMAGRFITVSLHRGENENAVSYISSVLIANIVIAIPLTIVLSLIVVFLPHIVQVPVAILSDIRILWALIFAGFLVTLVGSVYGIATFTMDRLDLTSRRDILNTALKAIILVGAFCLFQPEVWYIGLSTMVCSCFTVVTNFYLTRRLMPDFRFRRKTVDLKKIRELISSGIWNSISNLCSILLEELDLLVTNLFVDAASMGVVSLAKNLPNQMLSFFALIANAFAPQITIGFAKGNYEDVREKLFSAIRLTSFFACVPLACLYAYGKQFFTLWVPGQDADWLYIISILACLEFPLVIPLEPMWKLFTAANKTRQTSIMAIATAVASVTLTFVLLHFTEGEIPKTCVIVGTSSCLGLLRGGLFLPLYGAHCLKLRWTTFYPTLLKNVLGILIGTVFSLFLGKVFSISSWFMLCLAVVCTGIFTCGINFFLLLKKEDRMFILKKIRLVR